MSPKGGVINTLSRCNILKQNSISGVKRKAKNRNSNKHLQLIWKIFWAISWFPLVTWSNIFNSYHQGAFGWMRNIINLTETNPFYCIPFIRPFFSHCLHLFSLSSIKKSKLPFRPQKYDIWRSNDLQTISGNVHHESWKCIFPFPLWGLHARRRFNTIVAVSFLLFFLPLCLESSHCCADFLLLPLHFPRQLIYNSPCLCIWHLPIKAWPGVEHVKTENALMSRWGFRWYFNLKRFQTTHRICPRFFSLFCREHL